MTITRGIAAAAMLAGLAVGTAGTAWADPTMSGQYTETDTTPDGQVNTDNWNFTPCGDRCASVVSSGKGQTKPIGQARLANGQWTIDNPTDLAECPDGSKVPNKLSTHYTWDSNTLAGTVHGNTNEPVCGWPKGFQWDDNLQLRQAP